MSGLARALAGLRDELQALRRHYPDFVTRDVDALPAGDVPVFTFHTIEPGPFEEQLRHLQRNGYRTIDAETLLRHLTGEAPAPANSVMLTIDDGRKSVWTVAYPLLRRYGFKATVFLIPGYIPEADRLDPNLDDARAGAVPVEGLAAADPLLMSWAEIAAIHQSGVIDFQSHTQFHHRVPIASEVLDFLSPRHRDAMFDLAVPAGAEAVLGAGGPAAGYGLPLFASASLMRVRPRFRPEPAVLAACTARVRAEGGAAFFATRGWTGALRDTYGAAVAEHGPGRFDTPDEIAAAVRSDLERSRTTIEARLGKACRHLCYPYTEGSPEAVRLSREAGFQTNFWGIVPGRPGNRPGDDPLRIPRLKGDYVIRLPGEGRRSLASIMTAKIRRRLVGGPVH